MIEIAGRTYAFDDPMVIAALGAGRWCSSCWCS
jgi:hypothetical protein